jgi:hypothetical protein
MARYERLFCDHCGSLAPPLSHRRGTLARLRVKILVPPASRHFL